MLPMPDVEASLKEIEYAFDTLKAEGIGTLSNFGEKWPADFSGTQSPQGCGVHSSLCEQMLPQLVTGVGDAVVEFDLDTTRAITSLLFNGVLSG